MAVPGPCHSSQDPSQHLGPTAAGAKESEEPLSAQIKTEFTKRWSPRGDGSAISWVRSLSWVQISPN